MIYKEMNGFSFPLAPQKRNLDAILDLILAIVAQLFH